MRIMDQNENKNKHTEGKSNSTVSKEPDVPVTTATHIQKFRVYWSGARLWLQEEKKRPEQLLKR